MKKIIFVTPEDAKYGFSLAGIVQHAIKSEEFEETLKMLVDDSDSGVIAIDERLLKDIDHIAFRKLEEKFKGVIVIVPSPEKPVEVEDYLMRLIKRAIGYHMRLRI